MKYNHHHSITRRRHRLLTYTSLIILLSTSVWSGVEWTNNNFVRALRVIAVPLMANATNSNRSNENAPANAQVEQNPTFKILERYKENADKNNKKMGTKMPPGDRHGQAIQHNIDDLFGSHPFYDEDSHYQPDTDRFDDHVGYERRLEPRDSYGRQRRWADHDTFGHQESWGYYDSAKLNRSDQFDTKHKIEDEKAYRTEAKGAQSKKANKPKPGDHTDEYDYYDVNATAPLHEVYSAKRGSHADHYNRERMRSMMLWPSIEEMVGNDLQPSDEKRQWPAFKRNQDYNKDFYHFKDRDDWPFKNHKRKFPWRKTDSQRFHRKAYDEFDISNEQASRKALLDGHDPRAPEQGPYRDHMLPKKKSHNIKKNKSDMREAIDMIDNIININDDFEKSLKEDNAAETKPTLELPEDIPIKVEKGEPEPVDEKESEGEQQEEEVADKEQASSSESPAAEPEQESSLHEQLNQAKQDLKEIEELLGKGKKKN